MYFHRWVQWWNYATLLPGDNFFHCIHRLIYVIAPLVLGWMAVTPRKRLVTLNMAPHNAASSFPPNRTQNCTPRRSFSMILDISAWFLSKTFTVTSNGLIISFMSWINANFYSGLQENKEAVSQTKHNVESILFKLLSLKQHPFCFHSERFPLNV